MDKDVPEWGVVTQIARRSRWNRHQLCTFGFWVLERVHIRPSEWLTAVRHQAITREDDPPVSLEINKRRKRQTEWDLKTTLKARLLDRLTRRASMDHRWSQPCLQASGFRQVHYLLFKRVKWIISLPRDRYSAKKTMRKFHGAWKIQKCVWTRKRYQDIWKQTKKADSKEKKNERKRKKILDSFRVCSCLDFKPKEKCACPMMPNCFVAFCTQRWIFLFIGESFLLKDSREPAPADENLFDCLGLGFFLRMVGAQGSFLWKKLGGDNCPICHEEVHRLRGRWRWRMKRYADCKCFGEICIDVVDVIVVRC